MHATLIRSETRLAVGRSLAAALVASLDTVCRAIRGVESRPIESFSDQLLADIGLSRASLVIDALPRTGGVTA